MEIGGLWPISARIREGDSPGVAGKDPDGWAASGRDPGGPEVKAQLYFWVS